jgi:hypothetical protein
VQHFDEPMATAWTFLQFAAGAAWRDLIASKCSKPPCAAQRAIIPHLHGAGVVVA